MLKNKSVRFLAIALLSLTIPVLSFAKAGNSTKSSSSKAPVAKVSTKATAPKSTGHAVNHSTKGKTSPTKMTTAKSSSKKVTTAKKTTAKKSTTLSKKPAQKHTTLSKKSTAKSGAKQLSASHKGASSSKRTL